jgi:hypothetical protein
MAIFRGLSKIIYNDNKFSVAYLSVTELRSKMLGRILCVTFQVISDHSLF